MSKRERKNKKYSAKFKIHVIMDMEEHHLSYRETVRKHWETKTRAEEDKYRGLLKSWKRIYSEEGVEGLMKGRRGRASFTYEPEGEESPRQETKSKEELIVENRRLRMEVEYLKKLDALVQKRLQEEKKKQR